MNYQPQRIGFTGYIAIALVSLAIMGIVLAALLLGALWALIGGVFALGVISVALARVGVSLFSRYTDAALKRDTLRLGHIETMAKLGYLPEARNVRYLPMQQLEQAGDVPVSLQGITAEQLAEFKIHAVNLLALSKQMMGENSSQIAPHHKAKENDYFKDVAVWSNAVRYLVANQIAHERYKKGPNGEKKEGTYLNAGTVGQAFDALNRS